jgi:phosphoserine phosphatase
MQFFSDTSADNPMLKKVHQDIEKHKRNLDTWKAKLQQLRSL